MSPFQDSSVLKRRFWWFAPPASEGARRRPPSLARSRGGPRGNALSQLAKQDVASYFDVGACARLISDARGAVMVRICSMAMILVASAVLASVSCALADEKPAEKLSAWQRLFRKQAGGYEFADERGE